MPTPLFPGIQTSETHRHHNACVEDFMAGWKACSKDTEERVKQSHNEAIDAVIKVLLDNRWCFDTEYDREFVEDEIQKLKL